MTVLQHFPTANNAWVNFKHKMSHWRSRRSVSHDRTLSVGCPRNVLVVVIDCLRADHVSGLGHDRPTTPTLDAMDATVFSNAKAASPWTFSSIPSLLSGRYPRNHGARFEDDPRNLASEEFPRRPNDEVAMLPDLLGAVGYETGLITAIPMAERAVGDRFQSIDVGYHDAENRVDRALEWIDGRDGWFLHLHLGDPHAPLDIPERHRTTFDVPNVDGLADWRYRETTDEEGFEAYRDARRRAYDAAIRGADDALSRLFEVVPEDTVVVTCGDHGEAFWEHVDLERRLNDDPRGYYGTDHGHSVFEELLHVPLVIRAPGLPRERVDAPVSLVDVVPTVLDALEASNPPEMDGVVVDGAPLQDRPLLAEETVYGYNQVAVCVGRQKLVTVPATGTALAFDLDADPGEAFPLRDIPDELCAALESFGEGITGSERMRVDEETRGRLSELGYLE